MSTFMEFNHTLSGFPPGIISTADIMQVPLVGAAAFAVHPNEPNLYQIPSDLQPIYQPLPMLFQVCIWLVAALASAAMAWSKTQTSASSSPVAKNEVWVTRRKVLPSFLFHAWIIAIACSAVFQELLAPPTRITTEDLVQNYVLPSKLSRFETVQLPSSQQELGIHYLEYKSPSQASSRFQALYVNHGFGASSLSWLPVLPKMVDRFGARVGLGHDAVGFGFTDRPTNNLKAYTSTGSAAIGTALLGQQLSDSTTPVLLMGHSMGSLATLQMALSLPATTQKQVVLVAPALGMRPMSNRKRSEEGETKAASLITILHQATGYVGTGASVIGRYGLRRLVGTQNFWRQGLEWVWGDHKNLLEGDVLRFQWPSIGMGWEDGLLKWVLAMAKTTSFTDRELIEQLLESNTTTITVIVGSKDCVTPSWFVQSFWEPYGDRIRIVEMEGLGHDPFEEDVDGFLEVIEQVLEEEEEEEQQQQGR